MKKDNLRAKLKTAKGLGSAKRGSGHWMAQRITALALIALLLWLAASLICLVPADYAKAIAWVKMPLHAVALILLIPTLFYHTAIGLQVIYEDYIHCEVSKLSLIILTKFVFAAITVAAVFSILYINFKL